jgi:hypothetical protein
VSSAETPRIGKLISSNIPNASSLAGRFLPGIDAEPNNDSPVPVSMLGRSLCFRTVSTDVVEYHPNTNTKTVNITDGNFRQKLLVIKIGRLILFETLKWNLEVN